MRTKRLSDEPPSQPTVKGTGTDFLLQWACSAPGREVRLHRQEEDKDKGGLFGFVLQVDMCQNNARPALNLRYSFVVNEREMREVGDTVLKYRAMRASADLLRSLLGEPPRGFHVSPKRPKPMRDRDPHDPSEWV
jgi:hypothetical protein